MLRIRHYLSAAALAACLLTLSHGAQAQPGGPGGPGGGGPRGFRGPGGGPGSTLGLALNAGVQKELNVSAPQKTKLEALSEQANKKQQELRDQMSTVFRNMRGNRNNGNPNAQNANGGGRNGGGGNGGNAANSNGGGRRNRGGGGPGGGGPGGGGPGGGGPGGGGPGGGFNPGAMAWGGWGGMGGMGGMGGWGGAGTGYGGWGGFGMTGGWGGFGQQGGALGQGNAPGGPNGAGGRGNRPQMDPATMQAFAAMRESQNALQQDIDQAVARVLDRNQFGRLRQIQLQMAGIGVVLRPDIAEKLSLNDDQVMQIQQILDEGRQASRQNQRAYGELMRSALPAPADNNQNAPGAGDGGNNGRGRRGGPNFRDPAVQEAVKTFMEKPETKARIDQMKSQNDKIQDQIVSSVYRALTKRQGTALKKIFGPPFDMSKLSGNPNAQAGGSQGNADDAKEAKPAATPKATPKPAAKARRKSLRELRGLDD